MTVQEAIDRIDELKVNKFSREMKRAWLADLEDRIYKEVYNPASAVDMVTSFDEWTAATTYEEGDRVRYGGKLYECRKDHTAQSGQDPDVSSEYWAKIAVSVPEGAPEFFDGIESEAYELSVPVGYTALYLHYLEAQIDYWNGEITKYNSSGKMFEDAYWAWRDAFNRDHPTRAKRWRLW